MVSPHPHGAKRPPPGGGGAVESGAWGKAAKNDKTCISATGKIVCGFPQPTDRKNESPGKPKGSYV